MKSKRFIAFKMCMQAVLIVAILVGLFFIVRKGNERREKEWGPLTSGESYERFDEEKALDMLQRYFDGVTNKDMQMLKNVHYSKDLMTTFANYNETDEAGLLAVIEEQIMDINAEFKDPAIVGHGAYRDGDVKEYNEHIEQETGTKDSIQDMYAVQVSFKQKVNDEWKETNKEVKVYVTDGQYYMWPVTDEEK